MTSKKQQQNEAKSLFRGHSPLCATRQKLSVKGSQNRGMAKKILHTTLWMFGKQVLFKVLDHCSAVHNGRCGGTIVIPIHISPGPTYFHGLSLPGQRIRQWRMMLWAKPFQSNSCIGLILAK